MSKVVKRVMLKVRNVECRKPQIPNIRLLKHYEQNALDYQATPMLKLNLNLFDTLSWLFKTGNAKSSFIGVGN